MSYRLIPAGLALPLQVCLPSGAVDKYPRAFIYDQNLVAVSQSGGFVNLTYAVSGVYKGTISGLPAGRYTAVYVIYNDALRTQESQAYGRSTDYFELSSTSADVAAVKVTTDQFTFSGSLVRAEAAAVTAPGASVSINPSDKVEIAAQVWEALAADHVAAGTFGSVFQAVKQTTAATQQLLQDPYFGLSRIYAAVLNAQNALTWEDNQNESKIDTLLTKVTSILAALPTIAQSGSIEGIQAAIINEINENQVLLNAVTAIAQSIQAKTANLPADPASQGTLLGQLTLLSNTLSSLSTTTTQIKGRTDNLPADPAKESSVLQIPRTPLLANDIRLNLLANLDARVSSIASQSVPANLATRQDVQNAHDDLSDKTLAVNTLVQALTLITNNVKAKTDRIPTDPASVSALSAAVNVILAELAANGPELTAAQVWSYINRSLTVASGGGGGSIDISNLATKQDLLPLAKVQYTNRMSTVYSNATQRQEVIVWAEKDGQRVIGGQCTVAVKDANGVGVWEESLETPNADGIFKFSSLLSVTTAQNYYIVIGVVVDGILRVTNQSFFTVI